MLPNDSGISKELIFFLKDRLGLSDTSIFLDEYSLSNKEENLIKEFIDLKAKDSSRLCFAKHIFL